MRDAVIHQALAALRVALSPATLGASVACPAARQPPGAAPPGGLQGERR